MCLFLPVLEFTLEPSDTIVPEGSSVLLQCAGQTNKKLSHVKDGKISPNIRWRGPDGQDIGIDTFRVQLTNGSLYISSVNENRGLTGNYQCLLSVDGVGTIVSRTARLSIACKLIYMIFLKSGLIIKLFQLNLKLIKNRMKFTLISVKQLISNV